MSGEMPLLLTAGIGLLAALAQEPERIAYQGVLPDDRTFVLVLSGRRAPFLSIPREDGGHYPVTVQDFDEEVLGFAVPGLDAEFVGTFEGDRVEGFSSWVGTERDMTLTRVGEPALQARIGREHFDPDGLRERVEALMLRAEAFGWSGQVVVRHRGRVVVDGAWGIADDAAGTPVTSDTVFGVASMSKNFTAAAILVLVQEGKLTLEDKLEDFFEGLPLAVRDVSVAELLTHSSGLGHPRRTIGIPERVLTDTERRELFCEQLTLERSEWSTPTWEYNNFGYQLLAEIVALRAETPFSEFVRRRLLEPAELSVTGFYGDRKWPEGRVAHAYWGGDQGTPSDWPGLHHDIRGNSGMVSNARELTRWVESLAAGAVLPPELREGAWTAQVPIGGRGVGPGVGYGHGWFVQRTLRGGHLVEHGGDYVMGFSGWLAHWPEDGLSLAITCNRRDQDGNWLRAAVEGALQRMLWGRSYRLPPDARRRQGEEGAELIATWTDSEHGTLGIAPGGGGVLHLSAKDQRGAETLLRLRGAEERKLRRIAGKQAALGERYLSLVEDLAAGRERSDWPRLEIFERGWKQNIVGRRGPFVGVDLVCSTPSGANRTSTYLRVRCRDSATLLRFDEEGGGFVYWEYDTAAPESIAIAPAASETEEGAWIAHDLFTGDTFTLRHLAEGALRLQADAAAVRLQRSSTR